MSELGVAGEADQHITSASSLDRVRHLHDRQWQCYPNTAHSSPWEIPDRLIADMIAGLINSPSSWQLRVLAWNVVRSN